MAIDSLGQQAQKVISMRAEYKKQALLGDVLYPVVISSNIGDNKVYTVNLQDSEGLGVCTVQLKMD